MGNGQAGGEYSTRNVMISALLQSLNDYQQGKRHADELIKLYPDFESYYFHSYFFNSFNELDVAQKSINKMKSLSNKDNYIQQRSILLMRSQALYHKGCTCGAIKLFNKAMELTQKYITNESKVYALDQYLLACGGEMISQNKHIVKLLNDNDNQTSTVYSKIQEYLRDNKPDQNILKLLDDKTAISLLELPQKRDILLLLLRYRPCSNIIHPLISQFDLTCTETQNLLLTQCTKPNMCISDFASVKLCAYDELTVLFKTMDNLLIKIFKDNINFPELIVDLICDYVKYIQCDTIFVDTSLLNLASKHNDDYYCNILSFTLSPCLVVISIDEHGDMSKGQLQDPSTSVLVIEINNDKESFALNCDSISFITHDLEYQIKGKITYYLSPDIITKLSDCESFRMYFQYGIYPNGGYDSVVIFDNEQIDLTQRYKQLISCFLQLDHM